MGSVDSISGGPLKIVAIGGGTGLSTLLKGLKIYASGENRCADITAIVTVTDDGGSSGRLRRDFSVLPPGDIRNCMVALSEDEALLSRLFQYRFSTGRGLKGHSFGNLFLTALTQLTGDFQHAVKVSSEVLAIVGRIYPSTSENVVLEARLGDGRVERGESNISKARIPIERISIHPARPRPLPETLAAIAEADLITLGPGSLFTSLVPNLLVDRIADAIRTSRAKRAYIANLMWQPGETIAFSAADHVEALYRHAGSRFLDTIIVNTTPVSARMLRRYARTRAKPVVVDYDRLGALELRVVGADLLAEEGARVRHDPIRTAVIAMELAVEARCGPTDSLLLTTAR
jgi:uncharacterized cofD-like protein